MLALNFYSLHPNSVADKSVSGQTSRWIDQLFHDSAAAVAAAASASAAAAAAKTVADNGEGGGTDRMPVEMTLQLTTTNAHVFSSTNYYYLPRSK
jgi:hypothetical protein